MRTCEVCHGYEFKKLPIITKIDVQKTSVSDGTDDYDNYKSVIQCVESTTDELLVCTQCRTVCFLGNLN